MKVLVTGAAGFIGSNFLHFLAKERPDWELCAADLLTYAGNLENIASLLDSEKASFVKIDISDKKAVEALFEKQSFDMVFHLAAESHVDRSIHSATRFVETNVLGTQNLLDGALSKNVKRFIHISTDEVYGSLGPTGKFLETTPLNPTNPYAASKAASDLMVLTCHRTNGLDAVITRCTNNYGPYQFPEKFIPLFITNTMEDKELPLYGDGMNVRTWIHVDDHSRALLAVAEDGVAGEVYNIGGSEDSEVPNKQVAERIIKALNKPSSLLKLVTDRPAHDRRYAIDYSKLSKELGWEPQINFDDGLEKTITWYKENRSWWEKIKSGAYLEYYEKNYANR